MSRRPISSQGKAKPDVKSYPTRPSSTASRQKKSGNEEKQSGKEEKLSSIESKEDEQRRLNEELDKQFPGIAKKCEDLLAHFQISDQDLEEEMRKAALPNEAHLLDGKNLESIEARERAFRRMNSELNEKNAGIAKECTALIAKYDPDLAKELDEVMMDDPMLDLDPDIAMEDERLEAFMAKEVESRRMNEELERDNIDITEQAEALLGIKLDEASKAGPVTKSASRKPPPSHSGIKKSQSAKQVKMLLDNLESVEVSRSHSQLEDRTDDAESADPSAELGEDFMATDFSEVVWRIEARMESKIEEAKPRHRMTGHSKERETADKVLETPLQTDEPKPSTRPATAPAPVPKAAVARARGPIDDIEPPEEVGTEAIQRFLKAKLRVLQEELDRASEEIAQKEAELQQCKKELVVKQEQGSQLDKQVTSLRTQCDKQQKRLDLATRDLDNSKIEIAGLKRELDSQQRNQKKVDSTQSAVEVRLNRALEDIEKYKTVIQQMKGDSKDSQQSTSKKLEGLQAENKMLFKQREELMAGFKKQMKLIDNLKRQKMHMEAAKMLAFSEEEFMRVLDWWKVSD